MNKTQLFNFFFADYCRIIIITFVIFGLILFLIVLYKAFSNKKSNFNLLFIVMVNVILCSILSASSYLLNWVIFYKDNHPKLLFGNEKSILCKAQSILIGYFVTSRESLLTSITIIVFINYKNGDTEKNIYKFLIFAYSYLIPVCSNFIAYHCDAFGISDLFCFYARNHSGNIFLTIHLVYLIILLLLNLSLVLIIMIMDYYHAKPYKEWLDDENSDSGFSLTNSAIKKIILFPIGQLSTLTFVFIYRFGNENGHFDNDITLGRIATMANALSSILYSIIFIISNNMMIRETTITENRTKSIMESDILTEEENMESASLEMNAK